MIVMGDIEILELLQLLLNAIRHYCSFLDEKTLETMLTALAIILIILYNTYKNEIWQVVASKRNIKSEMSLIF